HSHTPDEGPRAPPLSLHDALPIYDAKMVVTALENWNYTCPTGLQSTDPAGAKSTDPTETSESIGCAAFQVLQVQLIAFTFDDELDRKSTRLNSSHVKTSYAVFCLK